MLRIGYHISHEQFLPARLLKLAKQAEEAGFEFCLSSDHFAPWSNIQGQSGFAWSWLGAALAVTKIDFGIVNCPTFRYHPAIIAQASATLDQMFPGRFWLTTGSGQALNESITGEVWPPKPSRNDRLKAAVDIIRALWNGETVTSNGPVKVSEAKLYTMPETTLTVTGAAITPETAGWMASWADSLITVSQPEEKLKKVIRSWKENGGEKKPMKIKVQLSYDKSGSEALEGAWEQWKTNVFGGGMQSDLRSPGHYESAALHVKPEDVKQHVNISPDPEQHIEWISRYAELGFSDIDLHNVNVRQEQFLEEFGARVLPKIYRGD